MDAVNPRTQSRTLPPHISCGEQFVAVESHWQNIPHKGGLLHDGSIDKIFPVGGKKSFEVLIPRNRDSKAIYVFVDSTVPTHVKVRVTAEMVRAYAGLSDSPVRKIIGNVFIESYFLEFAEDGDDVAIFHSNGAVTRLVRSGDEILQEPITPAEMAHERIQKMQDQISCLDLTMQEDVKRLHGIIASAIRLLRFTNDKAAENKLIEFLVDEQARLTKSFRIEIYELLRQKGHLLAGNFAEGFQANNVVQLASKPSGDGKAHSEARKRARAAEDQRRAALTKGPTGQKGQQSKSKAK